MGVVSQKKIKPTGMIRIRWEAGISKRKTMPVAIKPYTRGVRQNSEVTLDRRDEAKRKRAGNTAADWLRVTTMQGPRVRASWYGSAAGFRVDCRMYNTAVL